MAIMKIKLLHKNFSQAKGLTLNHMVKETPKLSETIRYRAKNIYKMILHKESVFKDN